MFKNRTEAGRLLLIELKAALSRRQKMQSIVAALPRGGVPVAVEIASALACPLTVLVSKKIPAPFQPEFALGAVSSTGAVVLNHESGFAPERSSPYIETQRRLLSKSTKEMEERYLHDAGYTEQLEFGNKRVIVVDDGIATGMTVLAAIESAKTLGAAEVIVAAPVVAPQAKDMIAAYCDEVVAVEEPYNLGAIGFFYEDFHQVEESELKAALSLCSRFH